jgi:hypothetical protein
MVDNRTKIHYNKHINSNKQELKMARETKAQREARVEAERLAQMAVARATYTERLMAVLARATKENFELSVKASLFVVEDRDDRRGSNYSLTPTWNELADSELYTLELSVELKEEARTESERRYQAKQTALAKLTKEERELLNLV